MFTIEGTADYASGLITAKGLIKAEVTTSATGPDRNQYRVMIENGPNVVENYPLDGDVPAGTTKVWYIETDKLIEGHSITFDCGGNPDNGDVLKVSGYKLI